MELAQQMEQYSPLSAYGAQENGYFTGGHTLPVLQHFVKYAVPERPIMLIMDGASGHIDDASLGYAVSNNIIFYCCRLTAHICCKSQTWRCSVRSSSTGATSAQNGEVRSE